MTANNPYDYSTRRGIHPISWNDFHGLCKGLALAIVPFDPEIILPIGRGGYYPGTLLAHMLQVEIYPVRLSRRFRDIVRYRQPKWLVQPPEEVRDRRVLVVDEICGSGETIRMVTERATSLGAAKIRSAVLYAHSWGIDEPDYIGLISDALLLNPWDREIIKNGAFQPHPEYAQAFDQQGLVMNSTHLIAVPPYEPVKRPA
jgi:hypoxanthine phosphoribosyltransferase